jgi:hypothetical protein
VYSDVHVKYSDVHVKYSDVHVKYSDLHVKYSDVHVKYPLFFYILKKIVFLDRFSKNTQIPNFLKTSPQGAAFHADRGADRQDEANCRFLQFCERV